MSEITPDRPRPSFWVYVPPPPLFVVTFVAGVQLGRWVPLHLPAAAAAVSQLVGIAIIVGAALLLLPAPLLFLRNRTTIIPHGSARVLVTSGPYRVTRNPMYVALVAAFVGLALALNVLWPLVLLPLPVAIVDRRIIPFEENRLTQIFGEAYRAYQQRVRRWL